MYNLIERKSSLRRIEKLQTYLVYTGKVIVFIYIEMMPDMRDSTLRRIQRDNSRGLARNMVYRRWLRTCLATRCKRMLASRDGRGIFVSVEGNISSHVSSKVENIARVASRVSGRVHWTCLMIFLALDEWTMAAPFDISDVFIAGQTSVRLSSCI